MRTSRFARDFRDLHGENPPVQEFEAYPVDRAPAKRRWAYAMPWPMRVAVGSVALFWTIALGALAVGAIAIFGVFVWAALTAPALPYS